MVPMILAYDISAPTKPAAAVKMRAITNSFLFEPYFTGRGNYPL